MPPFVSTDCPYCKQHNRFDMAELRNKNVMLFKKALVPRHSNNSGEEFSVVCQRCGRKFKFALPGGQDDPQK